MIQFLQSSDDEGAGLRLLLAIAGISCYINELNMTEHIPMGESLNPKNAKDICQKNKTSRNEQEPALCRVT